MVSINFYTCTGIQKTDLCYTVLSFRLFLFIRVSYVLTLSLLVSDESDDLASAGALLSTLDLQAQNVASEDTVGGGGRDNSRVQFRCRQFLC